MEKVNIYIDAGNFHHLVLKKLGIQEAQFDFEKFSVFLANGREVPEFGKRFYVGTVREVAGSERSKEAMSKQTSLFAILKENKWEIKTSKLRTRLEKIIIDKRVVDFQNLLNKGIQEIRYIKLREKGIDVKIATDLIVGAVDDKYDTAIIVSSDTDLIPAIDWVRGRKKKKIEYIGFSLVDSHGKTQSTVPTVTFIKRTDIQRTLIDTDLRPFIKPIQARLLNGKSDA